MNWKMLRARAKEMKAIFWAAIIFSKPSTDNR